MINDSFASWEISLSSVQISRNIHLILKFYHRWTDHHMNVICCPRIQHLARNLWDLEILISSWNIGHFCTFGTFLYAFECVKVLRTALTCRNCIHMAKLCLTHGRSVTEIWGGRRNKEYGPWGGGTKQKIWTFGGGRKSKYGHAFTKGI